MGIKLELFITILIFAALSSFFIFSTKYQERKKNESSFENIRFDKASIYEIYENGTKSILKADIVKQFKDKNIALNLELFRYNKKSQIETLKSKKAKFISDSIVIKDGFEYKCEDLLVEGINLTYNINTKIAKSNTKYHLKKDGFYISGDSFLFQDSRFISKNIVSTIEVNR